MSQVLDYKPQRGPPSHESGTVQPSGNADAHPLVALISFFSLCLTSHVTWGTMAQSPLPPSTALSSCALAPLLPTKRQFLSRSSDAISSDSLALLAPFMGPQAPTASQKTPQAVLCPLPMHMHVLHTILPSGSAYICRPSSSPYTLLTPAHPTNIVFGFPHKTAKRLARVVHCLRSPLSSPPHQARVTIDSVPSS